MTPGNDFEAGMKTGELFAPSPFWLAGYWAGTWVGMWTRFYRELGPLVDVSA